MSELLTLEHSNIKSRLRGICIYGGQMFSVTRHHKARLTTNREFQVARFFSRQVTALMYRYLVYIRPVAYAILRKCFQFEPQRTLLFTPASKSMRWTTKVFTEELKRLGQDALGADMEINVQLYRQLSIAITERHVREALPDFNCFNDVTKTADADVAFAWQSGHRPMQRYATHGLDGAFPDKLQPSLLRLYARCSERWHDFLMYGSRPPPPERRATEDACVDIAGGAIQAENSLSGSKRKQLLLPSLTDHSTIKRQRQEESYKTSNELVIIKSTPSHGPDTQSPTLNNLSPETTKKAQNQAITSQEFQTFGIFIHLKEFNILVCNTCQYGVIGDEVAAHLRQTRHKRSFTLHEKRELISSIQEIPGLFQSQESLLNFQWPATYSQPIPFIKAPKYDGLGCHICNFITRTKSTMMRHYRTEHQWVNPRKRGGAHYPVGLPDHPWRKNVICQQFFPNRKCSGWFEICRES